LKPRFTFVRMRIPFRSLSMVAFTPPKPPPPACAPFFATGFSGSCDPSPSLAVSLGDKLEWENKCFPPPFPPAQPHFSLPLLQRHAFPHMESDGFFYSKSWLPCASLLGFSHVSVDRFRPPCMWGVTYMNLSFPSPLLSPLCVPTRTFSLIFLFMDWGSLLSS